MSSRKHNDSGHMRADDGLRYMAAAALRSAMGGAEQAELARHPGVPSQGRLSHYLTDEPTNPLYRLAALVHALEASGVDREHAEVMPDFLSKHIGIAYGDGTPPIQQVMRAADEADAREDEAGVRVWAEAFDVEALRQYRPHLDRQYRRSRTLRRAVDELLMRAG